MRPGSTGLVEGTLSRIVAFYARTLRVVLGFPLLTLVVFFATIALTVTLYIKTPKGYFPVDDSGFVIGGDPGLRRHLVPVRCSGCSSNWPTS